LSELRPGEIGCVVDVGHPADRLLAARILEIGLVRGTRVRYLRAAPLGDPIEVDVEGFLLSLRRNEAGAVIVERE